MIGDGGDIVSYGARVINAWEPGHWLDAGPMGTLGAGTGFAIATKLARPDKQVAVLFGDGAFGLNGMEFETMVRHNLPVVAVIGNDGQWAQIKHPQKAMLGHATAADLAPGIALRQDGGGARRLRRAGGAARRDSPGHRARLRLGQARLRQRADRPQRRLQPLDPGGGVTPSSREYARHRMSGAGDA